MDTARVDITYRPLRIAWVIMPGDIESFRQVVRQSCTLAGGRYNPIIFADSDDAAAKIDCFGVDFLMPVGNAPELKAFVDKFPHMSKPFFGDGNLHFNKGNGRGGVHVLDVENILTHWHREPEWRNAVEYGIRSFTWDDADPLRDVFLIEHGAFPPLQEVHKDYGAILTNAALPGFVVDLPIGLADPIPVEAATQPGIASLSRFGVERFNLSRQDGWRSPGIYIGSAGSLEDLVEFWNIRAADVHLRFVDREHLARFAITLPVILASLRQRMAHLDDFHRNIGVWSQDELDIEFVRNIVGEEQISLCRITPFLWNGLNIRPPMMALGEESALGVVLDKYNRSVVSFALAKKPFSEDNWFYMQHVVASVSMFRSRADAEGAFIPPYVPELNETFGRETGVGHDSLRVERQRVGIVVDVVNTDISIQAIPSAEIIGSIFQERGLKASLSNAGLIARQLITQMGGIDSTRAFKIPGVRRLIRSSGLQESVTKRKALNLIGGRDPDNQGANFGDYRQLFIEQRPIKSDLTAPDVFAHLVAKRVFRIGADILCPTCRLPSWFPLDDLKLNVACTYCGASIDTTRQLVDEQQSYRRSGILGIERNLQGAIPVTMVLQQLWHNAFSGLGSGAIYCPSLDVEALDGSWPAKREVDFFAMELSPRSHEGRTRVVFGEAKDRGHEFDANDVETMKLVAAKFEAGRFEPYILFAKLNAFSEAEIALAADLAQTHNVILLTDQELEPLYAYDRAPQVLQGRHPHDLDGFTRATVELYPQLRRMDPILAAALPLVEIEAGAPEGVVDDPPEDNQPDAA